MTASYAHEETLSLEDAQDLVLSCISKLSTEAVPTLQAVGRVAAEDLRSDIDVSPFAHAAMDGFALRAEQIAQASEDAPVELDVIAEIAAGEVFEGVIDEGQCVRIMTGACLPADAEAVVKYEIVNVVDGDGLPGSRVSFSSPAKPRENIREAGEEAHAGETVVHSGEIINPAGVGFLASCGILNVATYRKPRVAVIATGSELVDASEIPSPGKIRNSNSYALAACVQQAGGIPVILPTVADELEFLKSALAEATEKFDFVITTGGAANGDFDFIKPAVAELGELRMTTVNMRPGKAQTFGLVKGVPVFGLPGNPAAAYIGFELIIRPALRKMQGYTHFERPRITARLASDTKKKDPRRMFTRGTLSKDDSGGYLMTPAKNQSSGLFGVIQRSNCLAVFPEGSGFYPAGSLVECILLDVSEETAL